MTPADELRTAATKLRKLTDDATPGPWCRPLNTRYKATVTGPLPEGERGAWLDGIDPTTGKREQCTVAMVPTWSNGKHSRQRGGRDLEFIAAMHPGVGAALAELLEHHALHVDAVHKAAANIWPTAAERRERADWIEKQISTPALAMARQINGSQS